MNVFLRCLSAEILKTRRTVYLLGVFLMPTILALFNFLLVVGLAREEGYYDRPNGWVQFEHNTITFWAILVLPFLVVLLCAFVAHQEHDTKQWRRLMCLPVPRGAVYLAKTAVVTGLIFFSSLVLWAENILLGGLVAVLRPELGLKLETIALWNMLAPFLLACLFVLFIAAIHLWFSLRVRNFVLSIGLGLALILAGFFLNEIEGVRLIFPWSLPSMVYKAGSLQAGMAGLAYSLAGFLLTVTLGCLDFIHRDVLA